MDDEAKEIYRQYKQYCDECSKAHDFTCSGADVKACEAKKKDLLYRVLDLANTEILAEGGGEEMGESNLDTTKGERRDESSG